MYKVHLPTLYVYAMLHRPELLGRSVMHVYVFTQATERYVCTLYIIHVPMNATNVYTQQSGMQFMCSLVYVMPCGLPHHSGCDPRPHFAKRALDKLPAREEGVLYCMPG